MQRNFSMFAHENIVKRNAHMTKHAHTERIDHNFKVGDKVLLSTKNLTLESGSNSRKMHSKYCGPFKILRKTHTCLVQN